MNPNDQESWLNSWEQQYVNAVEAQSDLDQQFDAEQNQATALVFGAFQDSAKAVAHLYMDKISESDDPSGLWFPFRLAAGSVATLYKTSMENIRRSSELAVQLGYQRRNRDLVAWVKRRRPHIRREDLLAYLAGKPPPPHPHRQHRTSPRPRNISPSPLNASGAQGIPPHAPDTEADLDMFREALTVVPPQRRLHSNQRGPRGSSPEVCAFIAAEIARHTAHKRPGSPLNDVNMESPTHLTKRQRFM